MSPVVTGFPRFTTPSIRRASAPASGPLIATVRGIGAARASRSLTAVRSPRALERATSG